MMPTVKNLTEFRAGLATILETYKVKDKVGEMAFMALEVEISGLALDYADGFYRDALRLKS